MIRAMAVYRDPARLTGSCYGAGPARIAKTLAPADLERAGRSTSLWSGWWHALGVPARQPIVIAENMQRRRRV